MSGAQDMLSVRIRDRDAPGGIAEVPGAPTPVPGLCVARAGCWWSVTHLRSGVAAGHYDDPEVALACAVDLGLLWDWTQPLSAVRDLPCGLRQQIALTCRRWGAVKGALPGPDSWADL